MLKAGKKVDQLMNVKDASSAGYLLRAEHVAKPHDSETARLNLERIEGISSVLKNVKAEVTTDLNVTDQIIVGLGFFSLGFFQSRIFSLGF